jgi:hypothetical protein
VTWVGSLVEKVDVTLSLLPETQTNDSITLYLLSFANSPSLRTTKRPPLKLLLRYLVMSWADTPQKAHKLLGQVAFAAMQNPEFTVDLDPLPAESWLALKIAPRPSFILSVPLSQDRPEPPVKLVRTQLSAQFQPTTQFVGRLMGPNGVPVVGARVELLALQLFEYTDANGQFRFATLPSEPKKIDLRVSAKGRQLNVTVEPGGEPSQPVIVPFDPFEATP